MVLRLIGDDELPSDPPRGFVTMYPAMLEVGVRVPFQRVIQEWLNGLGVAPAQINTNGYRMVIALVALWREQYSGDPPVEALHHLLSLKENASATNDPIKGFFCLIPKRPAIVTDLPSVAKSWRNKWFYVKGWSIATKKSGDPDPDPELVTCFKDVGVEGCCLCTWNLSLSLCH